MYLTTTEIGRLSAKHGKLTTRAYQIREDTLEITTLGRRFRCPSCGHTRNYLLTAQGTGEPVCNSYRCSGKPARYEPDPEDNFYVRVYHTPDPERLYPVEHSGQLSNEDRNKIERKFKDGLINTLVCTPTLELGVDIGDLVSLLMRNVPPTPANYAQRAGRAGRKRRIALILTQAGLSPHDAYFFQHPDEMITGKVRPPLFLLDNRVVINRHLNSLILEKLDTALPDKWEAIRTPEGQLREEIVTQFEQELTTRGADIQAAVAHAFVRERNAGGLLWLTEDYVQERLKKFIPNLRTGLEHWCRRYREIFEELRKSRQNVRPTKAEQERERKLNLALFTLETDRRYYPLSYLALVGFLPRYGFPGSTVALRDDRQREITQTAAVGLNEYAPGNLVYVGGRKLRVNRLFFPGGSKDDPSANAEPYKFCRKCDYATDSYMARDCPHCHEALSSGQFITYEAAMGSEVDVITQDDEYRSHEQYDTKTYLKSPNGHSTEQDKMVVYAGWNFEYSRLRQVEIYNRGRLEKGSGLTRPFIVCLECGMWHQPGKNEDAAAATPTKVTGHLPSCTVYTWNPDEDQRIAGALHLRAAIQGDVVEIPLPSAVRHDRAWIETFAQALKLGMQLEYFITPHELASFVQRRQEDGEEHVSLIFYDTMPGGTGYLLRLVDNIPQIADRAARHLADCACERACYGCLKDFWNQRVHTLFNKNLVLATLQTLAAAKNGVTLPAAPVQRKFESFLEGEFFELLQQHQLPLPEPQQIIRTEAGSYILRADFAYAQPALTILTDGRAFHASDPLKIIEDLDKRNALALAGQLLLEFTYWDVVKEPDQVIEIVKTALAATSGEPPALNITVDAAHVPAQAQAFVTRICEQNPNFQPGVIIQLDGQQLNTLCADLKRRLAVELITVDHWVRHPAAWQRSLKTANLARLSGWRVIRLPEPWLTSDQQIAFGAALL
ncbi:MAG: hypothetical protein Kow0031_36220 [Anaerolineae bacterium]